VPVLDELKAFNIDEAVVSLWVFKGPRGPAGAVPDYSAYWVETKDDVNTVLKDIVRAERDRIEEALQYDLLAQTNEASALLIGRDETYADKLIGVAAAETENKRAENVKKLQNSTFYMIKLVQGENLLYAVRRTSSIWKTKRALSARSLILADNTLALDNSPRFDIENTVDFFIFGQDILILHKGRFESTLRYKAAHAEDFLALQQEEEFADLFVDLAPLVQHVGANKIQLRRMCSVRQKAHYRDSEFMNRIRAHYAEYGLALQFDGDGKIIVTPETGTQVITALLDHRLASGFSKRVYDVPSATPVNV
jgi:Domain of unknown function (DUF4868)